MMFHSKVHVLCVQLSLLSRIRIRQGTSRYGDSNASTQRYCPKSLRTDAETGNAKSGGSGARASVSDAYGHSASYSRTQNVTLEETVASGIGRTSGGQGMPMAELDDAFAPPVPPKGAPFERGVYEDSVNRLNIGAPQIRGPSWWSQGEELMPGADFEQEVQEGASDRGGSGVRLVQHAA